jgi:hypothetical protein
VGADPFDDVFKGQTATRKPRSGFRKALPWLIGVLVVAVGLGIAGWQIGNTGTPTATPLNPNVPAKDVSQNPKTIKLEPGARTVAKRFILTAVARKHLAEAYKISGPQIVQGQSLKSWMTGDIAVQPYPVDDVRFAPMKIDYSYPSKALIEVALLPRLKSKAKPAMFMMEIDKIRGKWLVNSWVPRAVPLVKSED